LNTIHISLRLLYVIQLLIIVKNKLLNNSGTLEKIAIIFFFVYFVIYLVTVGCPDCRTSSVSIIMNIELKVMWTAAVADYIRILSRIVCQYWEKYTREPVKVTDFAT